MCAWLKFASHGFLILVSVGIKRRPPLPVSLSSAAEERESIPKFGSGAIRCCVCFLTSLSPSSKTLSDVPHDPHPASPPSPAPAGEGPGLVTRSRPLPRPPKGLRLLRIGSLVPTRSALRPLLEANPSRDFPNRSNPSANSQLAEVPWGEGEVIGGWWKFDSHGFLILVSVGIKRRPPLPVSLSSAAEERESIP
jgi:hypothetical protein